MSRNTTESHPAEITQLFFGQALRHLVDEWEHAKAPQGVLLAPFPIPQICQLAGAITMRCCANSKTLVYHLNAETVNKEYFSPDAASLLEALNEDIFTLLAVRAYIDANTRQLKKSDENEPQPVRINSTALDRIATQMEVPTAVIVDAILKQFDPTKILEF